MDQAIKKTEAERIQLLEKRFQLADDIDALLERCFIEHKDLAATIDVVFQCLQGHLHPAMMFLRTFGDDLEMRVYTVGIVPDLLEQRIPTLLRVTKPLHQESRGISWYAIPLDMSGETVGAMGLAFPTCGRPANDNDIFSLMNAVAEELDNYFYAIQDNRRKHQFLLGIQKELGARILQNGIPAAINLLLQNALCKDLLLLYFDDDLGGDRSLHYFFFRDGQQLFNAEKSPFKELDDLISTDHNFFQGSDEVFEQFLPLPAGTGSTLIPGERPGVYLAKLLVTPAEGTGLSIQTRELIQIFSESLRQRLLDFNRERNQLRRHFSVDVTNRLLTLKDYATRFLSPRTSTIGVMIADLSSFTLLSEELLKDPETIANFINKWSTGAIQAIFQENGVLDKLIGDSIVALFGPPFNTQSSEEIVSNMIRSALYVRSFTRSFLRQKEFEHIRAAPFFKDLGVGISLHFGPAHVAQIGPHKDLTAFGDGLNKALRLQFHAKTDQILVTGEICQIASTLPAGRPSFEDPEICHGRSGEKEFGFYRMKL